MNSPARSYLKATFWERLAALLIDELVLFLPVILVQISSLSPVYKTIIEKILTISYNIFLLHYQGATLGKKFMKIKVVSVSLGKPTLGKIILRETLGKWISNIFMYVGNLWVLIDKDRQAWHDKIAKTYVVKLDDSGKPVTGANPQVSRKDKAFFFLLWGIPFILSLFVLFSLFVAQPHQVKGIAMEPSLKNNEYFITNKLDYKFAHPKRGDIIVYSSPKGDDADYIKRIIGLPGEQLTFFNGKIFINDKELKEPYLASNTTTNIPPGSSISQGYPVVIPASNYFVLGDNREHSVDSRDFGPVPKENIIGKYWFTYFRGKEAPVIINK